MELLLLSLFCLVQLHSKITMANKNNTDGISWNFGDLIYYYTNTMNELCLMTILTFPWTIGL